MAAAFNITSLGNIPIEDPFPIAIYDNGLEYQIETGSGSVEKVLDNLNIELRQEDLVFPENQEILRPGDKVVILRARGVNLKDGQDTIKEVYTQARYVRDFLIEAEIKLEEKDKVSPKLDSEILPDTEIKITRVGEKIIKEIKPLKFPIVYKNNSEIRYGEEQILRYGVWGKKEVTYKVTLENGKEVQRKVLEENILKEPESQIIERGTKIVIGKTQTGLASWYRYWGGMFAASTTIPKSRFVRVTHLDTGKSIIVKINDYGPIISGRVIDLDAVAFKKLAPLWKGVIPVKVEEIL